MTLSSFSLAEQPQISGRVLIISDAAPHRNGVGAYYADLMNDLSDHVDAIQMISPELIDEKWQGGWMLPLPGDNTQKLCLPNAFELQQKIRRFRPTVIVIPTPGLFGLVGALLAKRAGLPIIVGFHTWFEKLAGLYWNRVQSGLTRTFFEISNKALFRLAQKTLANSHEMVAIADQLGAPDAALMGTPLDQRLLITPVTPVPKSVRRVLFMGRLAAEKNVMAVVEAANACPDLTFTIAGDGPLREDIGTQASVVDNLRVLGWVDRSRIVELIDEHDVLVLPSQVESFGTVALEAMVRLRLVLVSDACGIVEWPDLTRGLRVISGSEILATELARCADWSEFELYSHCTRARACALRHVQWNRAQWLDHIREYTLVDSDARPVLTVQAR
ncbi:MAG: glycosyltransferase [Reinekea sp.]|nr:glycosyltransferase [Reinekea sp.]